MPIIINVVRGALKATGLIDRACFKSWADFLRAIPDYYTVEIPASVSGVITQINQPGEDDRDKIWHRLDVNGGDLGLYTFQNGGWHPRFQFADNQVIWVTGDSANVQDGFVLIDTGDPTIPSSTVAFLRNLYLPNGTGGFAYFAVRFAGF